MNVVDCGACAYKFGVPGCANFGVTKDTASLQEP